MANIISSKMLKRRQSRLSLWGTDNLPGTSLESSRGGSMFPCPILVKLNQKTLASYSRILVTTLILHTHQCSKGHMILAIAFLMRWILKTKLTSTKLGGSMKDTMECYKVETNQKQPRSTAKNKWSCGAKATIVLHQPLIWTTTCTQGLMIFINTCL